LALQSVNAETGVIQPVSEALAMAGRARVPVHVDAVQAFGRTGATCMAANTRSIAAHKIRGPKSIGALVTRPGATLHPIVLGGSQERGIRPGTVDPVAAAAFAVAAGHALESPARWRALAPLRDVLEASLLRMITGARVNGVGAPRLSHVTSIAFPGWTSPELVAALDLEGVSASGGSACSAGTAEPSPVLLAMGDEQAAKSSIRFSLGEDTTREEVHAALDAIGRVFARTTGV
jgi:cysteine desulfurase